MHAKRSSVLSVLFLCALFISSSICFASDVPRTRESSNKKILVNNPFGLSTNDPIWNYTFDHEGNNQADRGYSITETSDGGFVVVGETHSDFWVLRLDANGTEVWNTTIDNGSLERAWDVVEVSTGGYAVCGYVRISAWNYFYLVKLDIDGNVDWMRNYTGTADCEARGLAECDNGGFILVGRDIYGADMPVVRTDPSGLQTWSTTIAGGDYLGGYDVLDLVGTSGYMIAAGMENSTNDYMSLIKLDENGGLLWRAEHGGPDTEYAFGMTNSTDGGYVLCGTTSSWGGGGYDMYIVKFDSAGNLQWNQTYGGSGNEMCQSIATASDGGYMLAGYAPGTEEDIWLVRTDSEGEVWWSQNIHHSGNERPDKVIEVSDGGYALSGYVDPSAGDRDLCIYRLSEPKWNPEPISKEIELGEELFYDINATSTDGPLEWMVNDTDYFSIDSDGILRNATSLPIGLYALEITIEDAHGHWIQAKMDIAVTWIYSSFEFDSGQRTRIQAMVQDADEGFVFACKSDPVVMGDVRPWFVKYNESGQQVWDEFYPYGYLISDIIACSTGGYAAIGYATDIVQPDDDVWLLRMNENGQHLWNKTFSAVDYDSGRSLVEAEDGGFYLLGSTHVAAKNDFWLIRTDSNGKHLWNKTYGYASGSEEGLCMVSCTQGGYAMAGYTDGSGSGNNDAWLVRIDVDGNHLWNQSYHGSAVSIARGLVELADGGFALTGDITLSGETYEDAFITRTNGTGFVFWTNLYGGSLNDQGNAIVQIHNGTLVVTGDTYSFSGGNRDGYFLWVDLDGNVLSNESVGNAADNEYFNDIIEVEAGGVALGGFHQPFGSLSGSGYFVQKPILKWTETPNNQTIELGTDLSLQLKASSAVRVRYWWISDQSNFEVSPEGLLTNAVDLSVNDYTLTVRAFDHIHNMIQATITVSVVDTTAPSWVTAPLDQEINETETFSYQLEVFDYSDVSWTLNTTTYFSISSNGLITNTSVLQPGVYALNVSVQDIYGNALWATFSVTVLEVEDTTTTTTTTTGTSTTTTSTTGTGTTTEPPPPDMLLIIIVAGAVGAAIVVIVVVLMMRKKS